MAEDLSWFSYRLKLISDKHGDAVFDLEKEAEKIGYMLIDQYGICEFDVWADELKRRLCYAYVKSRIILDDKHLAQLLLYVWWMNHKVGEDNFALCYWANLKALKKREARRGWIFGTIVTVLSVAVIVESVSLARLNSSSNVDSSSSQIHGIMGSDVAGGDGVYICTGGYSKAYHLYDDCMGLSNCSGDIINISQEKAMDEGRHLCGYCKNR